MNSDDRSARQILGFLKSKRSAFWEKKRRDNALALFHRASRRVPAYKDFLKKRGVNPEKIKTFADFGAVPPVNKADYLRAYPLKDLTWDGSLEKTIVFTSTSGSTGKPFYFPRENMLDWESSIAHEFFLNNSSRKRNGPVLVIVAFGMGAWIGGIITYKAMEIAGRRGANICIITPGINKAEIFHALKELAPQFSETILTGYPPFTNDIIDEASAYGIDIKRLNLRLLFAAESFSEAFRDHLAKAVGIKNVYRDTMNVYGTADIGTMAYETPTSILVRRLALKSKKIFNTLFADIQRTPTLAQYNPFFVTFEAENGDIFLTGDNTVPLIRYAIGDKGGVLNFPQITEALASSGIQLKAQARKAGIENLLTEQPFVYVYERNDFSTKLYGAIIYPEPIKEALQSSRLSKVATGKFTMATRFDGKQNQFLEVNVELKQNVRPRKYIAETSVRLIIERLLERSAEYRNNYTSISHRMIPKVKLWPNGHYRYFKGGGKQRWVEK